MARKAAQQEMVLVGERKPQLREASPRSWTKQKERTFLEMLAETCNVAHACRAADVSSGSAYRRRKENAAFRAGWGEAIAVAYERLEMVLLDRAFNGTEKVVTRRDGTQDRMREYSDRLGLTLLKLHRDSAAEAASELTSENVEEIRERLIKKLMRLKARIEQEESGRQ